jgi:hypothetical protein
MDYREENLDKIKQLGYGIEEISSENIQVYDAAYYYIDKFTSHEELYEYLEDKFK